MPELSEDQLEKRAAIQKSATIWGVVAGVVVGLLLLWILGGQGAAVRFGAAIVLGAGAGFVAYRASFKSQASSAACAKCGAAFSRSRTDRAEALVSSTPKEERAEQEDKSVEVTTWTEETYDVTDTYTCAKCGDESVSTHRTTRRRDEQSEVEPAPIPKGWARSEKPEPDDPTEAAKPDPKPAKTKPADPAPSAKAAAKSAAPSGWGTSDTDTAKDADASSKGAGRRRK